MARQRSAPRGAHRAPVDLSLKSTAKFEIVRRLGVGGMAEVFLARDEAGRDVVVKRLITPGRRGRGSDDTVRMFLREAEFAGRLRHNNIVEVHDYGRDDEGLFIVMEYLQGFTLRELGLRVWQSGNMLPLEPLLAIISDVARGLDHAHNFKDPDGAFDSLIHRDVSPDNIFVTKSGVTKVLDFGIVKPLGSADVTATGILKGKFNFMAPELFSSSQASKKTDVYALGVTLYLLCTGKNPHTGLEGMALVRAIMDKDPPTPKSRNPDLPDTVDQFIMSLIARDPDRRVPNCSVVRTAIGMLLREKKVLSPRRLVAAVRRNEILPLPAARPGARPLHDWAKQRAAGGATDSGSGGDTSIYSDLLVLDDSEEHDDPTVVNTAATGNEPSEKTRIEEEGHHRRATVEDPTVLNPTLLNPSSVAEPSNTGDNTLVDGPFPAAVLEEAARQYALGVNPAYDEGTGNGRGWVIAAVAAAFIVLAGLGLFFGLKVADTTGGDPLALITDEPPESAPDVPPEDAPQANAPAPGKDNAPLELVAEADVPDLPEGDGVATASDNDTPPPAEADDKSEAAASTKTAAAAASPGPTQAAPAASSSTVKSGPKNGAATATAPKRTRAPAKTSTPAPAKKSTKATSKDARPERVATAATRKKPALKSIRITAPGRIKWRVKGGPRVRVAGGKVSVPAKATTLLATDPTYGVTVAMPVKSHVNYNALATGEVTIRARPWAEVHIGGKKVGTTPFQSTFKLVPGRYTLTMKWEGKTKKVPLRVKAGGNHIVAKNMRE